MLLVLVGELVLLLLLLSMDICGKGGDGGKCEEADGKQKEQLFFRWFDLLVWMWMGGKMKTNGWKKHKKSEEGAR